MTLVKRVDKVHSGMTVTYDSTVSGDACVVQLGSFEGLLFEGSSTPPVPVNGGISWWFKGSVNSPLEVSEDGMPVGVLAYSAVGNLVYMVMLVGLSAEGFGIGVIYMPDESSQEEGLLEGVLIPYGEEFSLGWSWSATEMQVWVNGELVLNKSHSTSWTGMSFPEGWGIQLGYVVYVRSVSLSGFGEWTKALSAEEMMDPLSVTEDCLLSFRGADMSSEGHVVSDGVMFYPWRPVSGYLGVEGAYSTCGLVVMTPGSEVSVSEGEGSYDVWYYDPADSAPVPGLEFRCLSPAEGDRELEVRSTMGVFDTVPEGLSVSLEALGGGVLVG